jgi:hypothetical protein
MGGEIRGKKSRTDSGPCAKFADPATFRTDVGRLVARLTVDPIADDDMIALIARKKN